MSQVNNTGYADYPEWRYKFQNAEQAAQAAFKTAREQAVQLERLRTGATGFDPDIKLADVITDVLAQYPGADKQALVTLAETLSKQPEHLKARDDRILETLEKLIQGEYSDFTAGLGSPKSETTPEELHKALQQRFNGLFSWIRENKATVFEQGEQCAS